MQRNWIGRSEGASIDFEVEGMEQDIRVFTTRPDTVFGATFTNPSGLPDTEHVTSAYDLALIARHAMTLPEFREIVNTVRYIIPETNMQDTRYLYNGNRLIKNTSHKYEGANGIQAIDLLFRKLLADKFVHFSELMKQIDQTIIVAGSISSLESCANAVKDIKDKLEQVVTHLIALAEAKNMPSLYAKAAPLLETIGDVILGWMHLWQLTIAYPRLKELDGEETEPETLCKKKDGAFYYGKVACARFYIETLLKRTDGKISELRSDADPVVYMFDKSFSG